MKIKDIIEVCHGELISGDINIKCKNFTKDTRTILEGDIYVGIKGEVYDGNTFYKEAFNKGAIACILDNKEIIKNVKDNETIILVEDTIKALAELAKYKRSMYNIPVIAVTGSVGKTSVKDMIYSVVKTQYKTLCTKGNMNNHIGVPLTILGLDKHEALIVEMGMNHFNELHVLSNIAKPTIAVITNIGTAHIGNLGSRENILKAKLEVLDGMNNGTLIINNDNDMLRTDKYDNLITIGIDNKSDYMAHDIEMKAFSSEFYINDKYVSLPVGSNAFIYNALFAYAVGRKVGISEENIIKALETFKLSPHRLEMIHTDEYTIIDDTYNASLDSVKNSLGLLSKVDGRRVFIFADILEVDSYGEEIHKNVGLACVDDDIDVVICVGKLAKYTYEIIKDNDKECYYFDDNDKLIQEIDKIIKKDDTILIKGSHSMNLLEIVNYLEGKNNGENL